MSEAEKAVQELRNFLAKDCNISKMRICSPLGGGSDDIENKVLFVPIQLQSLETMGPRGKALFEALHLHLEDQERAYGSFVFDPQLILKLIEKTEKTLDRREKTKRRLKRPSVRSFAKAQAYAFEARHTVKEKVASEVVKPAARERLVK